MLVDPAVLRSFAEQADDASGAVIRSAFATTMQTAADGMECSSLQWAARQEGHAVAGPITQFADTVSSMGKAVRGSAANYEVSDDALAGEFAGLWKQG